MADEKKIEKMPESEAKQAAKETEKKKGIVELDKPYSFEGTEYKEIDISGIFKLTVKDAIEAQKKCILDGGGAAALITERTSVFARQLAVMGSEHVEEFFKLMPRMRWKEVQQEVIMALRFDGEYEDKILRFDSPYFFEGQEYTEIDMSNLANMTCMDEIEAENKMVASGIPITEPTYNYLYACTMASKATGKKIEFFTGLPIVETLKLKNAVNDPDFFE